MDIEDELIKQEDNTPNLVKEEKLDESIKKDSRIIMKGSVPPSNIIVLRRNLPADAPVAPTGSNPTVLMPPPLTQLRKHSATNKTFAKKMSNAEKASPRLTYDRRKIVAQERSVDVLNRMANSLSTMAKTLPLLTQEVTKLREELEMLKKK